MTAFLPMSVLFSFYLVWIYPDICSGFGVPARYVYYNRSPLSPPQPQLKAVFTNTTRGNQIHSTLRRTGRPYAIIYPLTIHEPSTKKDITRAEHSPHNYQVESRVLNKPQLHPHFGIPSPTVEVVEEVVIPGAAEISAEGESPLILPQHRPLPQKNAAFYQYEVLPPQRSYDFPNVHREGLNKTIHHVHHIHHHHATTKKPEEALPIQHPTVVEVAKRKSLPVLPEKEAAAAPGGGPGHAHGKVPQQQQQFSTCVCVAQYLCKNGYINSGGRLLSALKRKARSPSFVYANHSHPLHHSPSKIVNYNGKESSSRLCEPGKVCCLVQFEGDVGDNGHDDHHNYPVATPAPEPHPYPFPPRYPAHQEAACGIRRVYGVQGRLNKLQYGTDVAEFGEYPWQVAVLKKVQGDKSLYLCGGVLVAPQWVATVAHCLKRNKSSPLLIRLGEWDVNRKDEVYPYIEKDVTTIIFHPEFDPESLENDLALIRMVDPVDPRIPHVTPACLPYPGQVFEEQKCWVSGWGKDFFGSQGEYQNVLKEVDVGVVSPSLCSTELRSTKLGSDFKLHPGFLCAGGEAGKDACTGDGGSPLVCKTHDLWFVVGLVSWGIGCGQVGIPGVYVNVLYYVDWINSITLR